MKPLLVLARITFVGCLWSIIFTEGIRVIMLESWRFDIFWPAHWLHAWNLWSSGWVIDTPKEWAFILIIVAFIPMLLTGWIALSLIPWEHFVWKIITYPFNLIRSIWKPIKIITKQPVVVKRKSYKEIRPAGPRAPIYDYNDSPAIASSSAPAPIQTSSRPLSSSDNQSIKSKAAAAKDTFSHALFNLSDEDDDFDLDFDSFEKSDIFKIDSSKPKNPEKRDDRSDKNNRFEFHDDEEDDENYIKPKETKYEDEKRHKNNHQQEDDYNPRRYSDNEEYSRHRDNKSAASDTRSDNRKNDNRRDRREDRRVNAETRNERRRDNKNENKKQPKENISEPQIPNNPVADILMQKGYDVVSNLTIKNTLVDFIGVAEGKICLCLVDKEPGDWLADEERFNDEEPLWFSESSHRISPVRKADIVCQALSDKLESNNDVDFEIKPFVIIQMGNIINAEDMFEVWDEIGVEVTRINRGSPKEIKLFSKSIEEAEGKLSKNKLDTLKKLMRNIT